MDRVVHEPLGTPDGEAAHTGTSPAGCSTSVCNTGLEISRFLRLFRSARLDFGFRVKELFSFPSLLLPLSPMPRDGVRFTLEMSLDKLDLSVGEVAVPTGVVESVSLLPPTLHISTRSADGVGSMLHVGVIILPRLSTELGWLAGC